MSDEIQITIPAEAIKQGMVASFVKEFIESMGTTFDQSVLNPSIVSYDAVIDPKTRELRLTLVIDASVIKPRELPKYITRVDFGGKLHTTVYMDLSAMFGEFGRIVYADDEKIIVSVPVDKLEEIQKYAAAQPQTQQQPAVQLQRVRGTVTTR